MKRSIENPIPTHRVFCRHVSAELSGNGFDNVIKNLPVEASDKLNENYKYP